MKETKLSDTQIVKATEFITEIKIHKFTKSKGICDILSKLDNVYIRAGYTLDAYCCSYDMGSDYVLYPRRVDAGKTFEVKIENEGNSCKRDEDTCIDFCNENVKEPCEFDFDMIITGTQPYIIKKYIPGIDSYVSVPDTAEGIWQLYLLNIATDYMPLGLHSSYRSKIRIFTQYALKTVCRMMEVDFGEYLNYDPRPKVIWRREGVATVECWYFNDWSGLCKEYLTFTKTPEGYYIQTDRKVDILVKYDCGILF